MTKKKCAVVTGANQGLGLALVRGLLSQFGREMDVLLTARSEVKGLEAKNLLEQEGLTPKFHQLDITDDHSVRRLAEYIQQHYGGVDIFMQNAAARISKDIPQAEQVRQFINTNNHGTFRILERLIPLLNPAGRLMIVASSFGSLRNLNPDLHSYFDNSSITYEKVNATMDYYVKLVESYKASEHGWPDWINIPSKIGQVALMRIAARLQKQNAPFQNKLIAAVCPGLVDTEASRPWFDDMSGAQSPDQAAKDIIWLLDTRTNADQFYGELVQFRKIIPWK